MLLSSVFVTNVNAENTLFVNNDEFILYVGGNGPGNYTTIQDALNNSDDDYTIFVFNGVYTENLTIDKKIKLLGENRDNTVIDGNYSQIVIHITTNNVIIKNFTVRNSNGFKEDSGVKITSNKTVIDNCIIYRTKIGVSVFEGFENTISNCVFHTNGNGILINSSENTTIKNSQFSHNALGINVKNSNIIDINNSYVHTCSIGAYFEESSLVYINQTAVCDTNDNGAGVFALRCGNVIIFNSNFYHNGNGIEIDDSVNVLIKNCDILCNTHQGATRFENCYDDLLVTKCKIFNNFQYGIRLINSNIEIKYNNFFGNKLYAVYSEHSKFDARFNWWGFFTGPSFFNLGFSDRITRLIGSNRYFPWKLRPICGVGSDWETDDRFEKIVIPSDAHLQIKIGDIDTDNDGCPDWWEEKWGYAPFIMDNHSLLDPDNDSLNNIEECFTDQWGSNPFYKDVFLEIDWINTSKNGITNRPSNEYILQIVSRFNENGINIHIDVGDLGGGAEIPYKEFLTHSDFCDIYWDYFLHNDLNNPRKGVFHYGLITNYDQDESQVQMGWDHIDYSIVDADGQCERHPEYSREKLIAYAFMHELGHTFGLFTEKNPGVDNICTAVPIYKEFWRYFPYKSCMNYRYVYRVMDYSNGESGRHDYDDWGNLDLSYFKNTIIEWPSI